jgi:hypothetical protein
MPCFIVYRTRQPEPVHFRSHFEFSPNTLICRIARTFAWSSGFIEYGSLRTMRHLSENAEGWLFFYEIIGKIHGNRYILHEIPFGLMLEDFVRSFIQLIP